MTIILSNATAVIRGKNIAVLFLVGCCSVAIAQNPPPRGHYYEVTKVTAEDTTTPNNGGRKSSSVLRMVFNKVGHTAKLAASTKGKKPENPVKSPNWKGWSSANKFDGSETADWMGIIGGEAMAKGTDNIWIKVKIELISPVEAEIKLKIVDQASSALKKTSESYLKSFGKSPDWKGDNGISIKLNNVSHYGKGEEIGVRAEASGSETISLSGFEWKSPVPIPILTTGMTLYPKVKSDGLEVKGSISFTYDESKNDPWQDLVKGELEGSSSIGVEGDFGYGKPEWARASIVATVSTGVFAKLKISSNGRKITISSLTFGAGVLKGKLEVRAAFIDGTFSYRLFDVEGEWPSENTTPFNQSIDGEITIYEIPQKL